MELACSNGKHLKVVLENDTILNNDKIYFTDYNNSISKVKDNL